MRKITQFSTKLFFIVFSLFLIAFALFFFSGRDSSNGAQLRETTVNNAKQSTVLIKVNSHTEKSSGSGFVFRKVDDTVYIATNTHVIEGATSGGEPINVPINVVLNSGSRNEQTVSAEIAGIDRDNDIAILAIIAPNQKSVLHLENVPSVTDTMEVFVLGFPFGTSLSASSHNPSVTVSKGAVSSIRKDDEGIVKVIQIDASVNPGNSGGPVIDRQGNLLGIAFAKVRKSQIGFVVPIQRLVELSNGIIKRVNIVNVEAQGNDMNIHIKYEVLDPFHRIQSVKVAYASADYKSSNIAKPLQKGYWAPLREEKKMKTAIGHWVGKNGHATLIVPKPPRKAFSWVIQPEFTTIDGATHAMRAVLRMNPQNAPIRLSSGRTKKLEDSHEQSPPPIVRGENRNWLGDPTRPYGKESQDREYSDLDLSEMNVQHFTILDATISLIPIASLVNNMVWSSDGKWLIAASKTGGIYKIPVSLTSSEEIVNRKFGNNISCFGKSRSGLIVLDDKMQEISLIREGDLKKIATIPVGSCKMLATSLQSDKAFVSNGQQELKLVNLKTKTIEQTFYARSIWREQQQQVRKFNNNLGILTEWTSISMTPDGKYLFCGNFGCLHRFRIKGNKLVYEEISGRIASSGGRIENSPDSKYVAIATGTGTTPICGFPCDINGIYVFKTPNLQAPVMMVVSGPYPNVLAFDVPHNRLYSSNIEKTLLRFDSKGNVTREYQLDKRGNEAKQILLHPQKNILALRTDKKLFIVKFEN